MSSNNRASLLAGLRTGGVRQVGQVPQTAAPNVSSFPRQDMPMTAAIGGSFNQMYSGQAQAQLQAQQQAIQMQMMQMEIMRLQALQQVQQQYQMEVARQQQQQQTLVNRRNSMQYAEPQSAAPATTSFGSRRASQAEQLKSQLHLNQEHQVPMTASLGGKFGGRLNPNATAFRMSTFPEEEEMAKNPNIGVTPSVANNNSVPIKTTVISGGTSLGMMAGANGSNPTGNSGMAPSKSDTSLNWRRGGNAATQNVNRTASLNVRVTSLPGERNQSPPGLKNRRPEPLRFSVIVDEPSTPLVVIDNSDGENGDDADDVSTSSSSKSEPTTPPSSGSEATGIPPLSPREAATKRLYEGLGIGRPVPQSAAVHTLTFSGNNSCSQYVPHTSAAPAFPHKDRVASMPVRQPRGPPSVADELGPKNFASRIRRKAIGGLGAMLGARVNRQEVEAF